MSDLLSRMIARATRPVSRVEPILASRYESPVAIEAPLAVESMQQPAPRVLAERVPEFADREEEITYSESPLANPAPKLEHNAASVENAQASRMLSSLVPATVVEIDSPVAASLETASANDDPRSAPQAVNLVQEVEVHAQRVEITSLERAEIHNEIAAVKTETGKRRRAEVDEFSQPEPVEVHVTIGHIEVRAAPVPKAPVRRTAPPRVSLDDYLKRRNGALR